MAAYIDKSNPSTSTHHHPSEEKPMVNDKSLPKKNSAIDSLQKMASDNSHTKPITQLKNLAEDYSENKQPLQKKNNDTGLPKTLKSGIENLSGHSMDDVNVHYNSNKPTQLNAHAYAQGNQIHLANGQEKHLPHEAWHVVQQKQGRVQPTHQLKHANINDDSTLEKEADIMGARALSAGNNAANESDPTHKKRVTPTNTYNSPQQFVIQKNEEESSKEGENTHVPDNEHPTKDIENTEPDTTSGQASPEEADTLSKNANENGELTTADGHEIAPNLDQKEKVELIKKGDKYIKNTVAAGTIASTTNSLVTVIKESEKPADMGAKIFDKTSSAFQKVSSGVTDIVLGLAKPIIDAGLGILGLKNRWSQWSAFKKSAIDTSSGKEEARQGAPEEAKYGLTKALSGFLRYVKEVFMNLWKFTANLLTIIPGAQLVGAPMKIFHLAATLLDSLYKGGKSIYQRIFGQKKDKHSANLLDKAITGDQEALQLILDLKLGSIAGSGYKVFDWLSEQVNEASINNLAQKAGISSDKAERIIDKMGHGSEGPQTTAELKEQLILICQNSEASKELIRNEIKAAMTGYGT